MTTETIQYAKNPSVQTDADGRPLLVNGPLGAGHVYADGTRYADGRTSHRFRGLEDYNRGPRPACQSHGQYGQCQKPGTYLEPRAGLDPARDLPAAPDAPRFYFCGTHAPSKVHARKIAKRARQAAEDAAIVARREEVRREREELDAWAAELRARSEAITAARERIVEAARDSGKFTRLFDVLDAAETARDEWTETRP